MVSGDCKAAALANGPSLFPLCRTPRHLGGNLALSGRRFEVFKLKLHLIEQVAAAFRTAAVHAPVLRNLTIRHLAETRHLTSTAFGSQILGARASTPTSPLIASVSDERPNCVRFDQASLSCGSLTGASSKNRKSSESRSSAPGFVT